jgi:predicted methyltransferase
MKGNIFGLTLAVILTTLPGSLVLAGDYDAVKAKLESAMTADIRTSAEIDRDRNRKPVETLEFFGLRDDMKVVELFPGGGWYTKLLAPVLAENGEFYIAYGTTRALANVKGQPGFDKVQEIAGDSKISRAEGARFYTASNIDLGINDVDMVLTFRNYHNFDAPSRNALNQSVFKALKSGGIYAVVDHTRRHMQEDNYENRRRLDPVLAIKEIQAAGFEFVDYSPLHYRLDDELIYEVGRKTVTGNTDRWTLKFRKP